MWWYNPSNPLHNLHHSGLLLLLLVLFLLLAPFLELTEPLLPQSLLFCLIALALFTTFDDLLRPGLISDPARHHAKCATHRLQRLDRGKQRI